MAFLQSDEELNSEDIPVPTEADADVLGDIAWTTPLSYGRVYAHQRGDKDPGGTSTATSH